MSSESSCPGRFPRPVLPHPRRNLENIVLERALQYIGYQLFMQQLRLRPLTTNLPALCFR